MVCLASNHIVVLIRSMKTLRNASQRLEEEVANIGAPLHDEKVPALEENTNVDQCSANLPPMKEAEMRDTFAQMAQAITTQA